MKFVAKAIIGLAAAGAAYTFVQKRRSALADQASKPHEIHGFVSPGYDAVRDAFAKNFSRRGEIGAACGIFQKGQKVVDLWTVLLEYRRVVTTSQQ